MSDPGVVTMVISGLVVGAYTVGMVARTVLRIQDRRLAVRAMPVSDDRMARLEAAVESIAIEVERISEGQRFTTKILSENSQVVVPRIPPHKFDTPH
jgi:hypothetical protein